MADDWLSGDIRRKAREFKDNQEKLLVHLSEEVGKTPAVFEQAQKNRDAHQKRLNEMLEETLRQIKKCRAHMQQKCKHVMDTTKSYGAKFEHELNTVRETLRRDMSASFAQMSGAIDELEQRMTESEAALVRQREDRIRHIETTLGPIRDESQRLCTALDQESKARRLQDEGREKLIADEVEHFNRLLDKEKFDRDQHMMSFERWADAEQQQVAKRQYQMEKEVRDTSKDIRMEHHNHCKARVETQHAVLESIASFVHKYRDQVDKDTSLQNVYKALLREP
eukprot:TRINITY_DN79861_c0_g1_i1.p1 TRINITY_DN79861_c0_g1~~TRINITY_DN79861_c0_g1_i1.p1  ORF type:complete len:281 (-),score=61.06 TRINITY_DN79861_c0_g1_i1:123-965(-)